MFSPKPGRRLFAWWSCDASQYISREWLKKSIYYGRLAAPHPYCPSTNRVVWYMNNHRTRRLRMPVGTVDATFKWVMTMANVMAFRSYSYDLTLSECVRRNLCMGQICPILNTAIGSALTTNVTVILQKTHMINVNIEVFLFFCMWLTKPPTIAPQLHLSPSAHSRSRCGESCTYLTERMGMTETKAQVTYVNLALRRRRTKPYIALKRPGVQTGAWSESPRNGKLRETTKGHLWHCGERCIIRRMKGCKYINFSYSSEGDLRLPWGWWMH